MSSYYQALRVFAAVLLCALLQHCRQDIPTPVPAPIAAKQSQNSCIDWYDSSGSYITSTGNCGGTFTVDNGPPDPDWTGYPSGTGPSDTPTTGDGGGSGGGGTGNDTGSISSTTVLVRMPDKPIVIRPFLRCFDASQGASLTIYARQPVPGTAETWDGNITTHDVGHTFISITQNGITRTFGFYPISEKAIFDAGPSIFGDNSQTPYSVSISTQLSPASLNSLLTYIYSKDNATYNLGVYNCTDFGIEAAGVAGLTLPRTYGSWGLGGGRTPGTLGQDMRTLSLPAGTTRNLSGGTSPANAGGC